MNTILWFSLSPCGSLRRSGAKKVIQGWMISLEDELKKCRDIDLHVAFFSDTENNSFEFEGVTYHPIFLPKSSSKIGRVLDRYKSIESIDKEMLPVMLDVVKVVRPDLIHIHGTEERFGLIQDEVKDIPIVFSIQGLIAPYKEKFFSGLPETATRRYESLIDKLKKVSYKDEYKSFVFRAKREVGFLNKARYVFGRTFWDKDITGMLNVNRKYYVVDEILRTPFYQAQWQKESFSKDRFQIMSTISGGMYKGYETVLKIAALLRQNTDLDFEWVIAGYDAQTKWVRISEKYTGIKSSDVNVRLQFGRLDADQLAERLTQSDVYVHVSHIENSPNSVCEAMMVGMPVIASYAGGTGSMLKNEKEGLLVQDGDPYAYAGALISLYKDFGYAKTLGQRARETALVRHDAKRVVAQLINAYQDILKNEQI